MKKVTALVLVLVMVFALTACSLGGPKAGTYKMTGMTSNGTDYSPYVSLLNVTLVLNKDHTGYLDNAYSGDHTPLTWTKDSAKTANATLVLTYTKDTVTLSNNGTTMVFTLQK